MKAIPTAISDVFIIEPRVFGDDRGFFFNSFNARAFAQATGFAHGFLTLSDCAELLYKTTGYYYPDHERCIRWDGLEIGIA